MAHYNSSYLNWKLINFYSYTLIKFQVLPLNNCLLVDYNKNKFLLWKWHDDLNAFYVANFTVYWTENFYSDH